VSRILQHRMPPAHLATMRTAAGALAAFLAVAIAACGSSPSQASASSSQASASAVLGTTVQQDCTAVADVLSDGPDPDADPVGYAQAQFLQLRKLKIADAALRGDVLVLANAYQAFSSGSGAKGTAAAAAVTKAENSVNSICPQAAP
jgi:hypothetical protein